MQDIDDFTAEEKKKVLNDISIINDISTAITNLGLPANPTIIDKVFPMFRKAVIDYLGMRQPGLLNNARQSVSQRIGANRKLLRSIEDILAKEDWQLNESKHLRDEAMRIVKTRKGRIDASSYDIITQEFQKIFQETMIIIYYMNKIKKNLEVRIRFLEEIFDELNKGDKCDAKKTRNRLDKLAKMNDPATAMGTTSHKSALKVLNDLRTVRDKMNLISSGARAMLLR